ncbi:pleckstrin homology domain-containing family A member 5 isoform X16 [Silurus meridionalis]|uniref:pleckstrin homology domain-containing family A member 5 isoform X16 n=1 Tax=Silurus meridionalis TaxID=175797 RepID=UPI001EEA3CF3|nr:pleckstrin homology domain-containing family A member 5 isoform X16 [Silurus meridionalis]
MAADLNPDWISCLPSSWSYGVIRDGRVFFINEEAKSTTWLHPVTGEAVITGHRKTPDLPTGWEEGYTFEGARCFIKSLKHLHPGPPWATCIKYFYAPVLDIDHMIMLFLLRGKKNKKGNGPMQSCFLE